MRQSLGRGTTAKHSSRRKHAAHRRGSKHSPPKQHLGPVVSALGGPVHVVAKHPKPPKARGVGPDVACCPAEAVAEAARHAGWAVSREDVLDLYARCADGPTGGFTIAAALTAGLPGVPMVFESAGCLGQLSLAENGAWPSEPTDAGNPPTLILGVDSPGPHAVTVAPDGCWVSWGQHFDPEGFPDAVIEEAWEVIFPWAA